MAAKLPSVNARRAIRAFGKAGFVVDPGRGKGSHTVMRRPGMPGALVIPAHDPIGKGTLRGLITEAGLTVDQFVALL